MKTNGDKYRAPNITEVRAFSKRRGGDLEYFDYKGCNKPNSTINQLYTVHIESDPYGDFKSRGCYYFENPKIASIVLQTFIKFVEEGCKITDIINETNNYILKFRPDIFLNENWIDKQTAKQNFLNVKNDLIEQFSRGNKDMTVSTLNDFDCLYINWIKGVLIESKTDKKFSAGIDKAKPKLFN